MELGTYINIQGVNNDELRREIVAGLDRSKQIYFQRIAGITNEWSSTTRCTKCLKWWLWGVRDNLNFICDNCKNHA